MVCPLSRFRLHALVEALEVDDDALVRALADELPLVVGAHAHADRGGGDVGNVRWVPRLW